MPIPLTQEQFINKVRKRHGDKYGFEKTKYVSSRTELIVTCKKHNHDFNVIPSVLLDEKKKKTTRTGIIGSCPICQEEYVNNIKLQVIEKMRAAHNYEYDYDVTNYVNYKTNFHAICKKHGRFSILPSTHVTGKSKCPFCELEKGKIKTKTIDGVRYYNCDIHGIIEISKHREGSDGCPICNVRRINKNNEEKLKKNITKRFGNNFDFFITKTHIEFRCRKHGNQIIIKRSEFQDKKHNKTLCVDCRNEIHEDKKYNKKEELKTNCLNTIKESYSHLYSFIEFIDSDRLHSFKVRLSNLIEGGEKIFSVYSIVGKDVSTKKIYPKRPEKGSHISYEEAKALMRKLNINSFREYKKWRKRTKQPTLPSNPHHTYKEWVSHYEFFGNDVSDNMSAGERRIKNYLERKNIEFVIEKRFDDCRNIKPLPFDFYLPKYNLIVEFDGKQHYHEVKRFKSTLAERQRVDEIKNEYCMKNNINILRIPYWELTENTVEWTLDNEITRVAAEQPL